MKRENEETDKPKRKPYRKPTLAVLGDIRELTRAKQGTLSDGGSPKPKSRASGAQT